MTTASRQDAPEEADAPAAGRVRSALRRLLTPARSPGEVAAWFGLWIVFVVVRGQLEGLLEVRKSFTPPQDLFTCGAFLLAVFFAILVCLRLVTGRRASELFKPLVLGFSVILIVPPIDYVVSGGKGYYLAYPLIRPDSLGRSLLSLMGDTPGVSPGMRTEAAIILLVVFGVCRFGYRTGWIRALAAALGVYLIIFALGFYPGFMAHLSLSPIPRYAPMNRPRMSPIMPPMETRSALLVAVALGALALIERRRATGRLLKALPASRALFYSFAGIFGALLAWRVEPALLRNIRSLSLTFFGVRRNYPLDEWPTRLILIVGCSAALYLFAQVLNDRFDRRTDRINGKPNLFLTEGLSARFVACAGGVAGLWALGAALAMGLTPLVFPAAAAGLAVAYSTPPVRLKRLPLVSSVVLCGYWLAMTLFGFTLLPDYHLPRLFPRELLWTLAVAAPLGLQIKDLSDRAGDRAAGVWTLPSLLGPRWGGGVCVGLSALGFVLAGMWLDRPWTLATGVCFAALMVAGAWRLPARWVPVVGIAGYLILAGEYLVFFR